MHHTVWTGKNGLAGAPEALAQTSDGYLWIGTSSGLFRFDGVTFERYRPANDELPGAGVNTILATREGGLWVGFYGAGASFIAADGRLTNYGIAQGLPVGVIRSFAQDHDGRIWVAATGGLARLEAGRWHSVRMDWNYPCRSAWMLHVQSDGTLWVGGASPDKLLFLPKGARAFQDTGLTPGASGFASTEKTLWVNDGGHTIRRVRRGPDGKAIGSIFARQGNTVGALDRQGGVWLGGVAGITRYRVDDPDSDESEWRPDTAERFTADHGLTGRVWDIFIDREGNVWVATPEGIHRFRRRNVTWKADPALADVAWLTPDGKGDVWVTSWRPPYLWRTRDGAPVPGAPPQLGTILITGAGSGLGEGAAIGMARNGHDVIATAQISAQVAALRSKVEALGLKNVRVEKLDILDPYDVAYAQTWDVDVLFNNAGIGESGPASEIPVDLVRRNFETNVFAPLAFTQGFIRKWIANKQTGKKIVFTSSMGGLFTPPGYGIYVSTKHALEAIAEAMQQELKPYGIKVQTINPGAYLTGYNETMADNAFRWLDDAKNFTKRADMRATFDSLLGTPQGRLDPAEMIGRMVEIVPSDTGKFRNVVPQFVEDMLKQHQLDAWTQQI